ncbi:hypothetical protein VIS19158_10829 [Vibrio scophthalmi LMG 19158]|uniref:Uncharacterized protein n=1 Tax=Vibrio scophthalmi LMG 19158 TaxID=870967 RepID=F9RPX8_9VIBR|nr:hypothetical protein VIS19158_10829 [Vibrio scophthalmi LMG 19158]
MLGKTPHLTAKMLFAFHGERKQRDGGEAKAPRSLFSPEGTLSLIVYSCLIMILRFLPFFYFQ